MINDGTRVLGLGNIGAAAGLPVMEGKALLFKFLGGVDAVPIVVSETDPDKFVYIVKALEKHGLSSTTTYGLVNHLNTIFLLESSSPFRDLWIWKSGTSTM
ncbi:hypothetical protein [Thermosphaera aggregans]|uniref:hypothetical protein n=1 Tax=Thermosphaera aggregans TaxID=54254 RepID=UPI002690F684